MTGSAVCDGPRSPSGRRPLLLTLPSQLREAGRTAHSLIEMQKSCPGLGLVSTLHRPTGVSITLALTGSSENTRPDFATEGWGRRRKRRRRRDNCWFEKTSIIYGALTLCGHYAESFP